MFLLKPFQSDLRLLPHIALHSTMFLLKRQDTSYEDATALTLHSTMFLLKLPEIYQKSPGISALHSTMFLLKLICIPLRTVQRGIFTFHNVSIKTIKRTRTAEDLTPLHSTMFLLKRLSSSLLIQFSSLYIPQCFY